MKTKMKPTSLLAYSQILETLGERQGLVFKTLRRLKFASNLQLSKELRLPINSITPRINELRKWGIVRQYKKDLCPETGRLVCYWKPMRWDW